MSNPKRSFVSVNIQKIAINAQIINYHEEISKLTENNNYSYNDSPWWIKMTRIPNANGNSYHNFTWVDHKGWKGGVIMMNKISWKSFWYLIHILNSFWELAVGNLFVSLYEFVPFFHSKLLEVQYLEKSEKTKIVTQVAS